MMDLSMGRSRGGTGGPDLPLKNHKNIGFFSNTGQYWSGSPKNKASIQCCQAIIGLTAKQHLMVFRWRADNSPL